MALMLLVVGVLVYYTIEELSHHHQNTSATRRVDPVFDLRVSATDLNVVTNKCQLHEVKITNVHRQQLGP